MKKVIFLSLFFAFLAYTAPAEPKGVADISDEKISQIEALHTKAEDRLAQNDFSGAIKLYQDILLLEPDDEVAYTSLGRIYMIQDDTQKARECFQNALHIDPENETALLGLEKIKDPDRGFLIETSSSPKTFTSTTPPVHVTAQIEASESPAFLPAPQEEASLLPFENQIQIALRNAGLYAGEIDGKIGPNSRSAIMQFQKFHGLQMDGRVGPKTWDMLKPYLDRPENR